MYHYRESGLENVWLVNGYEKARTPYGDGVAIVAVKQLHDAIAQHLVRKPGRLTGREFRFLRTELGYSQRAFSEIVDTDENGVARWERGVSKVPGGVDRLIRVHWQDRNKGKVGFDALVRDWLRADAPERGRLKFELKRKAWKEAA